jgi:hypothetical protein
MLPAEAALSWLDASGVSYDAFLAEYVTTSLYSLRFIKDLEADWAAETV